MTPEIQNLVKRKLKKNGLRRKWPKDLKEDIINYYESFLPYHPIRKNLLHALDITPHMISQWKRRDKLAKITKGTTKDKEYRCKWKNHWNQPC